MALDMTFGRGDARFQYSDGEVESSVTINAADPEEAVLRKLRRLVALVEGAAPAAPPALMPHIPAPPGFYRDAAPQAHAPGANGWAAFSPPPVPDHLKDQVELIDPSEPDA